jgi:Integrase core domain
VPEARAGIGGWLRYYNEERPHQSLGYRTPCEVFAGGEACGHVDNACALLRAATALPTCPQAHHQEKGSDYMLTEVE